MRRSIRDGFDDRPVALDVVRAIVGEGLSAPSSKNAQPWRMHVVANRQTLGGIADAVQSTRNAARYVPIDPATGKPRQWTSTVVESAEVLRGVAVGIFVENRGDFSGGRATVAAADDAIRVSALVGYSLEMAGVGAAIQNMWLSAAAHGLAAVFMGDVAVAEEYIAGLLGLRGDLIGVLAIGQSNGAPVPKRLADDRCVWHV